MILIIVTYFYLMGIIRKETDYFAIKDGSEDGLNVEETRYISGVCYDDNWNFVGYNADLRDRKTGRMVAVVDFSEDDEEYRIRYCLHCEEFGFQNKLGVLTVPKGEKRPADWEQWLQCHECGNKYGRFESIAQKTLKMKTEQHEQSNPFDAKKSTFLHVDNRAEQRRKRELRDRNKKGVKRYTSKRLQEPDDPDPEVQAEIDRHGSDNVHIIK